MRLRDQLLDDNFGSVIFCKQSPNDFPIFQISRLMSNDALALPPGWDINRLGMATLTKRELVVKISNETGLVQHQVLNLIQKTLDHVVDALANGDTVELRNFGVFHVRLTKPRVGRNPTVPGSRFDIPARATVKFKSGKTMCQRVGQLSATLKVKMARSTQAER